MNALFPAAWGWLALAAPIIALYLIRTQLERRSVSTLLFWEQIKTPAYNSALWRRLRRWISLLLQLLFLLLVTFALTQPLAPWQSAQPAHTVFVLDPSASMSATEGGKSRRDLAVELLDQRIRQMRAFDLAAILVASDPPQVLSGWTSSRRALRDALKQLPSAAASAAPSFQPALDLAENLRATQPNSRIVVLTDGVRPAGEKFPAGAEELRIGQAQPNAGITHFSARRSPVSPSQVRVALEIISHAPEARAGEFEIRHGERLVDVQKIDLESGKPWRREWDVRSDEGGIFEAKLTGFPPDALAADDTARVELAPVRPVNVLLVSAPNAWLEAALAALPLVEWARVETMSGYPDPKALYVFNQTAPPPGFESANMILINPPEAGFWGRRVGDIERPLVSEVQKESLLMRHTGFASVSLDQAAKWEQPKSGVEVFADSFGDPLVYGRWDDDRRWALVAFGLDGSDFVLRTAFPILLGNAVESLRPSHDVSPGSAPGPVESALEALPSAEEAGATTPAPSAVWWLAFPLWWWALAAACVWLVVEWRLFTRRITE